MEKAHFIKAKPIWAEGREYEKNLTIRFRVRFRKSNGSTILRITASSVYRSYINGSFFGYGPARGPHGYYRVDEWNLDNKLHDGENILLIEVAGYNVNSFYTLDQPSFLQAEIISIGSVLAYTSSSGIDFDAEIMQERLQKVQRYSFQRNFVEVYNIDDRYNKRFNLDVTVNQRACLNELEDKKLLPRQVIYPDFKRRPAKMLVGKGCAKPGKHREEYWKDRSLINISNFIKGYKEEELEIHLSDELQEIDYIFDKDYKATEIYKNEIELSSNNFGIFDFGLNLTGFLGLKVHCTGDTKLILLFDEILCNGDVDFKRLGCVNSVYFRLKSGVYELETFEPYTLRYLKIIGLESTCKIEKVYIREYVNPDISIKELESTNESLNTIFQAAVQTFRQNAVDIYMDCPSRERAGWLCDSLFTARVEHILTGKSIIEKNFLENYLLPERFDYLPEGMLPMCYPADHYDGIFIPNWALWFVIELEEYLVRSRDVGMVNAFKTKVYRLFDYFEKFINEFGLLEKLESWVFVEWSKANEFVQDVNFPTNMLYAGALAACGRIYNDEIKLKKADEVKDTIRKISFDGLFFTDNAVRHNGKLLSKCSKTEVCQYYAFYFDVATPETFPNLWNILTRDFGPHRKESGKYPQVYPANAFIGNYLRLDILSRYGLSDKVISEIEKYFFHMAEKTGTLWEHDGDYASCNHGFASYIAFLLLKNISNI